MPFASLRMVSATILRLQLNRLHLDSQLLDDSGRWVAPAEQPAKMAVGSAPAPFEASKAPGFFNLAPGSGQAQLQSSGAPFKSRRDEEAELSLGTDAR